jgi:hypothetical protein
MPHLTVMVSDEQYESYKDAASACYRITVSEWARIIIKTTIMRVKSPSTQIPQLPSRLTVPMLSHTPRKHAFTIRVSEMLMDDIHEAALECNLRTSVFCKILLDRASGISRISAYIG